MDRGVFNPKDIIFSLDIGTRSIIGTVGVVREKKFEVLYEKYKEHEQRAMVDGQIHDINLVASVVKDVKEDIESELGIQLKEVSIAAAGRFLRTVNAVGEIELNGDEEIDEEIVRSVELSAVKKAEEEVIKNTESKLYCVGYSVKDYYLNSYVITNLIGHKGERIGTEVIATFLPRSVIDSLYTVMNKVNLKVSNLTLEPIAAIEAAVPKNLRLLNIALVDIGAGTSDIAISSKESICAYGMVPMAGDEITEVIAQECLVDFNSAENIKRSVTLQDEVTYTDVLGLENTIESSSIIKSIAPTVEKIATAISSEIISLNGNKPPAALFLVGGGAHTPGLVEEISNHIGLPTQRIAIKDRTSVIECLSNNELGSAGVTVLGIALSAIKKMGHDFIDVNLNGTPVSLFNSHKHTVMDVLLQAGVNPSLLIGKNGKSIRFTLNGKRRLAFGEMGKNAKISINRKKASIESEVNAGDNVKITYAQNGKDASPKVIEVIENINSIDIYIDDKLVSLEPVVLINGKEKKISNHIKDGDEILVYIPSKILDIKNYILKRKIELFKEGILLEDDSLIEEGDRIYSEKLAEKEVTNEVKEEEGIKVKVNNKDVILSGEEPLFIDIFNHMDIDITKVTGDITLKINGKDASYTDKLNNGDIVEVFWS